MKRPTRWLALAGVMLALVCGAGCDREEPSADVDEQVRLMAQEGLDRLVEMEAQLSALRGSESQTTPAGATRGLCT